MRQTDSVEVWWTEPASAYDYSRAVQIKPYLPGVDLENDRLEEMAALEGTLPSSTPLAPHLIPDELRWFHSKVPEKSRDLPDFFIGHSSALIASEAFRDLLSDFDLGSSQLYEVPLYDSKVITKMGRTIADYDTKDPRRWFIFHITETKSALRPEHCVDLPEAGPYARPGLYKVYSSQTPTIALDRETVQLGPAIWSDPDVRSVYFFSNEIKQAIEAAGLRTPILKFKPCILI